jgi:hypothetical protein
VPRDDEAERLQAGEIGDAPDFSTVAPWLLANWVRVTAVLLTGAQVWWMSSLLSHAYFKLDDFYLVERAASNGLGWNYLMWINAGHLNIVGNFLAWVMTRISPYDWTLASAVTLVLLAVAGLTLYRMLRTLFGEHPGILLLFAIYLLSPLAFAGLSWWTVVLEVLPLEIATFCAVTAHVHYLRTRRWRHLAVATLWLVIGMAASDKGVVVPLLLLAVSSAVVTKDSWRRALLVTLREYWRAWALYGAAMVAYVTVYLVQLSTSSKAPGLPGSSGGVFEFAWTLLRDTFVPGMLGGPWRWFAVGEYGVANPPPGLAWAAVVVAALIIGVSVIGRMRTWRLWVILAGWIIVADILPVLLGRGEILPGQFLGQETRYVMEVPGIATLIIGLAFLPLASVKPAAARMAAASTAEASTAAAGTDGAAAATAIVAKTQPTLSPGRAATAAIVAIMTAVLIGSLWSFHAYVTNTTSAPARSFFATARLALAEAPSGTLILNAPIPSDVLGGLFLGPAGQTARVMAPLTGQAGPRFAVQPAGTLDRLMEFDGWGRLVSASILGTASRPLRSRQSCWPQTAGGEVIVRLQGLPDQPTELRIGYAAGSAGQVQVTYAGQTQSLDLQHGLHQAFLPVNGIDDTVVVTGMDPSQLCIGDVQVGVLLPSATGPAIPALAVNG